MHEPWRATSFICSHYESNLTLKHVYVFKLTTVQIKLKLQHTLIPWQHVWLSPEAVCSAVVVLSDIAFS